ncbi:hypothetical protein BHM03_00008439 [Ensete ventricosum]|uniref:Uncharacterized protein n=1 Tax=Ensete ventricosum TaxID=4639 RepID=A0A445MC98_ENSVE|nr:hypothetical protein BHM03_00008439 [Ensete ventricosum]
MAVTWLVYRFLGPRRWPTPWCSACGSKTEGPTVAAFPLVLHCPNDQPPPLIFHCPGPTCRPHRGNIPRT